MKVLDLSCGVAGRFAAKLFAWGGAEVLRCAPGGLGGQGEQGDDSLSLYLDAGKQAADPAQLATLLDQCELVFTSFDQGRYLGHASGLAIPETCVHVTTSSFGTTGPYAAWRGGSMADWAAGGYLYITGDPGREPLSGPENMCAYAAGYTAAFGAEAALIDRIRSGRGRHLDISTMESMLLLHQSTFARTAAGELRRRTGRYTEVYPLTVLPCRDGHVLSLAKLGDPAGGECQQIIEVRSLQRRALSCRLDLDQAPLAGHDDVGVHLRRGVLGVVEVEQRAAVDDPAGDGRDRSGDR